MKKAALTFALFSTVLVATSFATPETNSSLNSDNSSFFGDGGMTGGKRKVDFHDANNESMKNNKQLNLDNVNQSFGKSIKLD